MVICHFEVEKNEGDKLSLVQVDTTSKRIWTWTTL